MHIRMYNSGYVSKTILRGKAGVIIYSLLFLAINIGFSSCNSAPKAKTVVADSTIILLPKETAIPQAEMDRLNMACRHWYDSVLKNSGFNGGILVARNGQVVFETYKGTEHLGLKDTIDATTPFHIASVSKTFTAMAVLKLAQEGKLRIDDAVSKYLTGFNYPGVTIKTLLDHRSGLPNYLYFMEDLGWDKSQYIRNQDVLDFLINKKDEIKNIGLPDKSFNYCNTNYVLLALIVEKVTGTPFPEHMQKTFFNPLGMKHTYIFTLADTAKAGPSYDWRGREIPINFLDQPYGDKNVYTTPRDLLIWDRALSSNILFRPETLESAYTPYSNEKPGIKNYGLGWRMNLYPTGKKMIFHNGWWHGNNAVFIRLLQDNATIIVVGNKYSNAIYKARQLANVFSNYFDIGEEEEGESPKADTSAAGTLTGKK